MIRQSLLLALCLAVAAAFAPAPRCTRDSTVVLQATRREIIMGTAVVVGGLLSQSLPVLAEVDDLAMPSEDEQKAAEVRHLFVPANPLLLDSLRCLGSFLPYTWNAAFLFRIQGEIDLPILLRPLLRSLRCASIPDWQHSC